MKQASKNKVVKKVAKKTVRKAAAPRRRYSPRQQQLIQDLADMLGKLVPATSQGRFSLQQIAKEKSYTKYFNPKLTSKKRQFVDFITRLHKDHPRSLKVIINDVLAEAVAKRRERGNPVLRPEADAFKDCLFEFGIDLRREIDGLQLPVTRPNITPPPQTIQQSLERIGLHPSLLPQVTALFKEGHINEAVRKAGEIYEANVLRWSGIRGKSGRDLMATAFNKDTPVIDVSMYHGSEISNPIDEKEGFMLVSMGAMQWCKNTVGHGDVDQLPPAEGASRIIMVSHLIQVVDTTIQKSTDTDG